MVEIKSEENNTVQLPNNIRQVGTPGEKIKIYIEDYVMTYLNQMTGEKPALQKAALLLGEKVKKESTDIYFISAAVAVVPMEWNYRRMNGQPCMTKSIIILKTGIYWGGFCRDRGRLQLRTEK